MRPPTAILFDLDDTLCDYQAAKEAGQRELDADLAAMGIDPSSFWRRYDALAPGLFRAFATRAISSDDFRRRRYAEPLIAMGVSPEIAESVSLTWNEIYMAAANGGARLFDDALPVLRAIRARGLLTGILTNGPADGQRTKLAATCIECEVDVICISEEIGVAKPAAGAYLHACGALGAPPESTWMVGNSLEEDVKGAERAGVTGILLDRHGAHRGAIELRVETLDELLEILA